MLWSRWFVAVSSTNYRSFVCATISVLLSPFKLTNLGQQLSCVSCSQLFASSGSFRPKKLFISGTFSAGIFMSILKEDFFWSLCSSKYSSKSFLRFVIAGNFGGRFYCFEFKRTNLFRWWRFYFDVFVYCFWQQPLWMMHMMQFVFRLLGRRKKTFSSHQFQQRRVDEAK